MRIHLGLWVYLNFLLSYTNFSSNHARRYSRQSQQPCAHRLFPIRRSRRHQDPPPKRFYGYQEQQYRGTSKLTLGLGLFTFLEQQHWAAALHGEQPRQFHIYTRVRTSIYPPHGEPKRASKTRKKNHVGSYHSSLCCMSPNNISTLFGKDKYLTAAVLQSVDSVESRRFIIINLAVYTIPLFAERPFGIPRVL